MVKTKTLPPEDCKQNLAAIKDALETLSGKWKLPIIVALKGGPKRFKELQRTVDGITPKILSKELKDMELNEFVTRSVYDTSPVTVEYELTDYSESLDKVILELRNWGMLHRKHLADTCRKKKKTLEAA